jgi:hypothetical protein
MPAYYLANNTGEILEVTRRDESTEMRVLPDGVLFEIVDGAAMTVDHWCEAHGFIHQVGRPTEVTR